VGVTVGVFVGGTGVSVGGIGVFVDGMGVSVAGMGVSVGGAGVSVGGAGVSVGGIVPCAFVFCTGFMLSKRKIVIPIKGSKRSVRLD